MWQRHGMTQERSEISEHEVKIYMLLKAQPEKWFTHKEIATGTGVAERTVRMHTVRFVKLGLLDLAELFPAHRYRFSEKGHRRNKSYTLRLESAAEIFGITYAKAA